jgi:hypothetical protein
MMDGIITLRDLVLQEVWSKDMPHIGVELAARLQKLMGGYFSVVYDGQMGSDRLVIKHKAIDGATIEVNNTGKRVVRFIVDRDFMVLKHGEHKIRKLESTGKWSFDRFGHVFSYPTPIDVEGTEIVPNLEKIARVIKKFFRLDPSAAPVTRRPLRHDPEPVSSGERSTPGPRGQYEFGLGEIITVDGVLDPVKVVKRSVRGGIVVEPADDRRVFHSGKHADIRSAYRYWDDFIRGGRSGVQRTVPGIRTTNARKEDGKIIIHYSHTDIAVLSPHILNIDTGGWNTHTTNDRLNKLVLDLCYPWRTRFTRSGDIFLTFSYRGISSTGGARHVVVQIPFDRFITLEFTGRVTFA